MENPLTAIRSAVQQIEHIPSEVRDIVEDVKQIEAMVVDIHARLAAITATLDKACALLHLG